MRVDTAPTISPYGAREIVAGTPVADVIDELYSYCVEAVLNPAFMLGVGRKETQFGIPMPRSIGDPPHRNTWALRNHGWIESSRGFNGDDGWTHYHTYLAAGLDHVDLITGFGRGPQIYIPAGLVTVRDIISVYAPASENYTELYIRQVERWMAEWAELYPVAPPGPTIEERVGHLELAVIGLQEQLELLRSLVHRLEQGWRIEEPGATG